MSFNKKKKTSPVAGRRTAKQTTEHPQAVTSTNTGQLAFVHSDEERLVKKVLGSFLAQDSYYESGSESLKDFETVALRTPVSFMLSLGNFARNKMNMRSASTYLLMLAASKTSTPEEARLLRHYAPKILRRADEPGVLLSMWIDAHGSKRKIPRQLLHGIGDYLNGCSEYELAKYDSKRNQVRLRDVIKIVHPRPTSPEQSELFRKALAGELKTPSTWETRLSQDGQNGISKKDSWNAIASEMGIFALTRNLRNFEETGANEALNVACSKLANKEVIAASRMLPFRFVEAAKHVNSQQAIRALSKALDFAVQNVPVLEGRTAVFVDHSGSMNTQVSANSNVSCREIADTLAAICAKQCDDPVVGVFATDLAFPRVNTADSVGSMIQQINVGYVGYGTKAYLTVDHLLSQNEKVDRVIVLSDMQTYDSWGKDESLAKSWEKYHNRFPDAKLYAINLAGYRYSSFASTDPADQTRDDVIELTGWSEKIFEYMKLLESKINLSEEISANW